MKKTIKDLRRKVKARSKNDLVVIKERLKELLLNELGNLLSEEGFYEVVDEILQEEMDKMEAWLTVSDESTFSVMIGAMESEATGEMVFKLDDDLIEEIVDTCDDSSIIMAVDYLLPQLAQLRDKSLARLERLAKEHWKKFPTWCPKGHLEKLRQRAPVIQPPLDFPPGE